LSDYINKKIEGVEYLVSEELNFVDRIIMEYHCFITQNNLSKLLAILENNSFAYQICRDQYPPKLSKNSKKSPVFTINKLF